MDARTSGNFYLEVVQAVQMLVSETWVMPPRISIILVIFYHQVILQLIRWQPRLQADGIFSYPPQTMRMADAVL